MEGEVVVQRNDLPDGGWYVGPTVMVTDEPGCRVATEEIFGPVLVAMRADDFDEALALAGGTDYALTGGLFSRSPARIARAAEEFRAGNLYINRGITGALVGRQPFGGFGMSGRRLQGRRPRLPAPVRGAPGADREHDPPGLRPAATAP